MLATTQRNQQVIRVRLVVQTTCKTPRPTIVALTTFNVATKSGFPAGQKPWQQQQLYGTPQTAMRKKKNFRNTQYKTKNALDNVTLKESDVCP